MKQVGEIPEFSCFLGISRPPGQGLITDSMRTQSHCAPAVGAGNIGHCPVCLITLDLNGILIKFLKDTVSHFSHSSCPGPCLLVKNTPGLVTIFPGGSQAVEIQERLDYFPIPWNISIQILYWPHMNLLHSLIFLINSKPY